MGRNYRRLPPDPLLVEMFDQGMTNEELCTKYECHRNTVASARKRLTGPTGSQHPSAKARKYPQADERRTIRPTEIHFKLTILRTVMSLPRIPTLDGHYEGQQS